MACIDIIKHDSCFKIAGVIDRDAKTGKFMNRYFFMGTDDDIPVFIRKGYQFLVTVGQIKSSRIRHQLFEKVISHGGQLPVIISSKGYVSSLAKIGQGTIVMHKAVVNAGSVIGDNCIINTGAIVEHGVKIGSHCHISTGAVLNGDVNVGVNTFIGSRSMISHGVDIGDQSVIGGGINLFNNVPSQTVIKAKINYTE